MKSFSYTRADDVATVVNEIGVDNAAKFIAGGTNLIDLMKENVAHPSRLIDITRLSLNKIENTEDGGLQIGALVTNAETAYNEQVEKRYPLLSKAILAGASPQLRNMATTGGNLLQRTRCYYFYDTATPCNKREPGTGCPAIDGFNRIHAILGTSEHCIATHPSDMCIALAALKAVVRVTGNNGDRTIPFAEFHRLPGDTPHIDTNLQADEIITAVDLPAKGFAKNYTYLKLRDRTSYAFALGAAPNGTLEAVIHEAIAETSQVEDFTENVVNWSGVLYQCDNVKLDYKLTKLDLYTPIDMRAPGAVLGVYALECAMDELAYKVGIDPLELRLKNYAKRDQNENKPFSSKELRECYRQGAEKFGWVKRNPEPRSMREGDNLIGWGMATGIWDAQQQKASAKAVLFPDGKLIVSSATADIGTGTYTIMTQIAAEALGLPIDDVTFKLADLLMMVIRRSRLEKD